MISAVVQPAVRNTKRNDLIQTLSVAATGRHHRSLHVNQILQQAEENPGGNAYVMCRQTRLGCFCCLKQEPKDSFTLSELL